MTFRGPDQVPAFACHPAGKAPDPYFSRWWAHRVAPRCFWAVPSQAPWAKATRQPKSRSSLCSYPQLDLFSSLYLYSMFVMHQKHQDKFFVLENLLDNKSDSDSVSALSILAIFYTLYSFGPTMHKWRSILFIMRINTEGMWWWLKAGWRCV